MTKEALAASDLLQRAKTWWGGLNPAHQKMLMGVGAGGALGLGSSMLRDKEERNPLQSTLTGALAGGAVGAGAAALTSGRKGGTGGGTPSPGDFQHGGKWWKLRPGVTPTPEQAAIIENLRNEANSGWWRKTVNAAGKGTADFATSPTGAAGIGATAAVAGRHAIPDSLRQKMPGWLNTATTPTRFGEDVGTSKAKHLERGLKDLFSGIGGGERSVTTKYDPRTGFAANREVKFKPWTSKSGIHVRSAQQQARLARLQRYLRHKTIGPKMRQLFQSGQHERLAQIFKVEPSLISQLAAHGAESSLAKGLAEKSVTPAFRESRMHKLFSGLGKRNPFPKTVAMHTRLGKARLAGKYALPLLLAGAIYGYGKQKGTAGQAQDELTKQLSQFAKPVPAQ